MSTERFKKFKEMVKNEFGLTIVEKKNDKSIASIEEDIIKQIKQAQEYATIDSIIDIYNNVYTNYADYKQKQLELINDIKEANAELAKTKKLNIYQYIEPVILQENIFNYINNTLIIYISKESSF